MGGESRRKRGPGHDYCIVRLGVPGIVRGVDIDTRFFTGNYPPEASLEACHTDDAVPDENVSWRSLLTLTQLAGDAHHYHPVDDDQPVTHLRLNIFPDGGIARLRVFGEVQRDWADVADEPLDLFALENGGRALACSDEHYGSMHNLNLPGASVNMGDGWETARRRGPGHDWVVLRLGSPGQIQRVRLFTEHFKGNYPDRATLQAAHWDGEGDVAAVSRDWPELLAAAKLSMDAEHDFSDALNNLGTVSHVRLNIFPDGGVSRLRILGRISDQAKP